MWRLFVSGETWKSPRCRGAPWSLSNLFAGGVVVLAWIAIPGEPRAQEIADDFSLENLGERLTAGRIEAMARAELASYFVPRETAYLSLAVTWSPDQLAHVDGWRYGTSTARGTWSETRRDRIAKRLEFHDAEAYFGWRWNAPNGSLTATAGIQTAITTGDESWSAIGARGTAKLVVAPLPNSFAALLVRAGTIRRSVDATLTTGFALPIYHWKLGPEVGVGSGKGSYSSRIGLALTGIDLFGGELALSSGFSNSNHHLGIYATAYLRWDTSGDQYWAKVRVPWPADGDMRQW